MDIWRREIVANASADVPRQNEGASPMVLGRRNSIRCQECGSRRARCAVGEVLKEIGRGVGAAADGAPREALVDVPPLRLGGPLRREARKHLPGEAERRQHPRKRRT